MAKRKISLSASALEQMHSALKKFEETNPNLSIGGVSMSGFLAANATMNDKSDPVEIRTKRRILRIAGNFTTDPATLDEGVELVKNLLYGSNEYTLLQMSLDSLVKEYKESASISSNEMTNCSTVGDCTSLVNSKIN